MPAAPTAESQVAFLGDIERLLSEGQYTATYKYALLVALADLAVQHGTDDGSELDLPVSAIAEKFIELYWRQSLPYGSAVADGAFNVLIQNTGRQAAIVTAVGMLRQRYRTLTDAKRSPSWAAALRRTADLLETMPLWRLQRLRQGTLECLYARSPQPSFIRLKPGVAANLRRFHGLAIRLAQSEWLRFIQSLPANASLLGPTSDLGEFLFGAERAALRRMVEPLADIQHGQCLYCGRRTTTGDVDHFIPWSRYPRDLAHNLVLAHKECNRRKSDLLAAEPHLERWLLRNADFGNEIGQAGADAGIVVDREGALSIAAWAYGHCEQLGASVWLQDDSLQMLCGAWRRMIECPRALA